MRGTLKFYVVVGLGVVIAYFVTTVRGVVFADTDARPGVYGGGGDSGGGVFFWGSGYRGGK